MTNSEDKSMFYGAKPTIFEKAKELRENMTDAEKKLWFTLQKKKIMGYRFRSLHPIDIFIADFCCHKLKLVIEDDGGIHDDFKQREYDIGREVELKDFGIKDIRISNSNMIKRIIKICSDRNKELYAESPL